jgi:hypothetical protein
MARQNVERETIVLAVSAFALGLVSGLVLKEAGKQVLERARASRWHRDYDRTVDYEENLPDSLARREPAPEPGQPRFGGTGALGVHPAAGTARDRKISKR